MVLNASTDLSDYGKQQGWPKPCYRFCRQFLQTMGDVHKYYPQGPTDAAGINSLLTHLQSKEADNRLLGLLIPLLSQCPPPEPEPEEEEEEADTVSFVSGLTGTSKAGTSLRMPGQQQGRNRYGKASGTGWAADLRQEKGGGLRDPPYPPCIEVIGESFGKAGPGQKEQLMDVLTILGAWNAEALSFQMLGFEALQIVEAAMPLLLRNCKEVYTRDMVRDPSRISLTFRNHKNKKSGAKVFTLEQMAHSLKERFDKWRQFPYKNVCWLHAVPP